MLQMPSTAIKSVQCFCTIVHSNVESQSKTFDVKSRIKFLVPMYHTPSTQKSVPVTCYYPTTHYKATFGSMIKSCSKCATLVLHNKSCMPHTQNSPQWLTIGHSLWWCWYHGMPCHWASPKCEPQGRPNGHEWTRTRIPFASAISITEYLGLASSILRLGTQ